MTPVIFDFGGVLVRWQPQEIISSFYPEGPLRAAVQRLVFEHPDWIEMDRGTLSEEDAVLRFAARMERPHDEMAALLQHVRDSLIPIDATVVILNELKKRGVPLYGLSNMSATNFAHLRQRYDLWSAFKGIVISADVRMVKPEARIFEHISRLYGLKPTETVFIDDHAPNIAAAQELGFRALHFRDPKQCADSLDQMLNAI